MKTVKLLSNVHISPNFGLGKPKYKEGECFDAAKGSVQEVNDDVAAVLIKRGLAEATAEPEPEPEAKSKAKKESAER